MLILVSGATTTVRRLIDHPNIGALITPRTGANIDICRRIPFGIDNDCYSGFDEVRYVKRLDEMAGLNPLFVSAPDAVGDANQTSFLFQIWYERIRSYGYNVAYVLQDGFDERHADYAEVAEAIFVGGTTDFKLSRYVADVLKQYPDKWKHMGRVNSLKRLRYAHSIGVDSIDGTSYSRFANRWLPPHLEYVKQLGGY